MLLGSVNWESGSEADESCVSPSEHSRVGVLTNALPDGLANVSDAVERLDTRVKLVTLIVVNGRWVNGKVLTCVPLASLRIGCDFGPESLMLGLSRHGQVFRALTYQLLLQLRARASF